jgi:alanine dehydrogenase
VRPLIEHVFVYDLDGQRAAGFARHAAEHFNVVAQVARTIEEAVRPADILSTITPARSAIVHAEWVKPGTHINAIGADAAGKQELESALILAARIVVDDMDQATHSGEVNVPFSQGALRSAGIYAELGEIVADLKSGRGNDTEITVFDSTGLALQDLACAAHVYRKLAAADAAGGTQFDFLK